MGDYNDGNSTKSGGVIQNINASQNIDVNALASALSKFLSGTNLIKNSNDSEFDDSGSMERIAKAMINSKQSKETNIDNLGEIKTTKRDEKEVQKTIDLLSGLND